MQEQDLPNRQRRQRCRRLLRSLPSTKTLEQRGFFLLVVLPIYITIIWCLLSRPIRISLFQFSMATMVWSANSIRSATSYAEGRTLTSQPILPAAAASTLKTPSPLAYHVWPFEGDPSLEASHGYINMCAFELHQNWPPCLFTYESLSNTVTVIYFYHVTSSWKFLHKLRQFP